MIRKATPKRHKGENIVTHHNTLPETGFVRLKQILGDPAADIPPVFPISRSSWYLGIKKGIYPAPVKLSARISAWRVEDIRALIDPEGLTK